MTTSSNKNTRFLLIQLKKRPGLSAKTNIFKDLDANSMVKVIDRKATGEELVDYLSKEVDAEPIRLETAFSKYLDKK